MRRFPQVHLGIGLVGNALFMTGSVLFMLKMSTVGVYFFIVGSSGMFLGSLGELLRTHGQRKLWEWDVDPAYPDHRWSVQQSSPSPGD